MIQPLIIYQSFSRDNLGNFIESIEYIDIDESIHLLNSKKILHFNIHCLNERTTYPPKTALGLGQTNPLKLK